MSRESIHRVRAAALEALAYASRLEMIDALRLDQPATAPDLAERLGREPRSLYPHLRALLAAGLVVEAGEQPTNTRPAKLYRVRGSRLELDPADRSKRAHAARAKLAAVILRRARRLHEAALEQRDLPLSGPRAGLRLGHRVVRLTPRGLARVNRKVRELFELLGEEHDPRGEPFALTLQVAPAGSD